MARTVLGKLGRYISPEDHTVSVIFGQNTHGHMWEALFHDGLYVDHQPIRDVWAMGARQAELEAEGYRYIGQS